MQDEVRVLVVQTVIREAMNGPLFEVSLNENLNRSIALIEKSVRRNGAPNLVVLPEFFLTGLSSTRSYEQCLEMARRIPGPETDALGELSARHGVYIAGATWERDETWPDRWFNTAFIVGPSGTVELKYRKINEGNYQLGLTDTTPGDVYDEYVERYGEAALWPVLETDFGNLACIICFDLNFAETTRMLAMRGAEIILNPTGEPYGQHRDAWELARRTRAFENLCYFASANHGAYVGTIAGESYVDDGPRVFTSKAAGGITPAARSHGGSEVVDYRGEVIARIDGQGEATIEAVLDLASLRRARSEWPAVLPTAQAIGRPEAALYAAGYRRAPGFPLNKLLHHPLHAQPDGPRHLGEVIEMLKATPIMASPGSGAVSPTVLAFQADIAFVDAGADDATVTAAALANVEATSVFLDVEVERTGADIVLLPDGWPVSFLSPRRRDPRGGIRLPGPELDAVASWAAARRVHVAGSVLERAASGPDATRREEAGDNGGTKADDGRATRYRTAFLIDDQGRLVHRHRSLANGDRGYEPDTDTPLASILDGPADAEARLDALLPVCRTKFGTIATLVGREVLSVEVTRLLVARGAQILLNPASEHDATLATGLRQARRVRASELCSYLVVAGQGQLAHPVPSGASRIGSMIVDYDGDEIVALDEGRSAGVAARLDMTALARRRSTGRMNKLVQLRPALYAPGYAARAELEDDEVLPATAGLAVAGAPA